MKFLLLLAAVSAFAEDWPEWRGKGRVGEFNESGILDTFPADGLQVKWRTPVHAGYSGPAVAAGRVFVTDFRVLRHDERHVRVLDHHRHPGDRVGVRVGPNVQPRDAECRSITIPTATSDGKYLVQPIAIGGIP